jgi:hypothetical protein
MSKLLAVVLITIAFLLSSVTAISVALAIYDLIGDKQLALLFASAAVLLDIFKYLAWPVAVRVLSGPRSLLMMFCAVMLSVVSAWATYDRMISSISHSQVTNEVLKTDRAETLKHLALRNSSLLESLDNQIEVATTQANLLRARGMVSKALELEESVSARTTQQRTEALQAINDSSLELTHIKSSQAKAAGMPPVLIQLLCLGFAICLEIVPALILSSVRCSKQLSPQETQEPTETPKALQQPLDSNSEILETLIKTAKTAEPGTPIKLKEFAKISRIGNLRAGEIFRKAEELGHVRKTTAGYVAA